MLRKTWSPRATYHKIFSDNSSFGQKKVSEDNKNCPKFLSIQNLKHLKYLCDVSNLRDSVPSDAKGSIFEKTQDVGIADETRSEVFDISSQLKQKLRSKRRSEVIKIYAN